MSAWFERLTGLSMLQPAWLALALLLPIAWWLRRRTTPPSARSTPCGSTQELGGYETGVEGSSARPPPSPSNTYAQIKPVESLIAAGIVSQ